MQLIPDRSTIRILVFVLLTVAASPLQQAQQKICLPSVALPVPNPDNIFTHEQEVDLGDAVAERVQKDYHIIDDQAVTSYLTAIGDRLIKHLPPTRLRFQFFLVDLPDANALAFPGGRIYVSRKLVALARSEDELAGVIGHELGHLVARDGSLDMTRRLKEVLGVTQVGDRRDIFDKYNLMIENFRRKLGAIKPRDREAGQMIADQVGFYALVAAGYDPGALADFWDRLTETRGKTGNLLSDVFGTTRPEERRLREMIKAVRALPAECVQKRSASQDATFGEWQSSVISYTGLGRRESLHGVLQKIQLSPPLRSDITHIRFSPDGKHVLAQDDSGINVLTREPFAPVFRIEAPDAKPATFSPDSQSIVFSTDNLRVEKWGVAEQKMEAKEIVVRKGCLQTALSSDGKFLACLNAAFELNVIEVATGLPVIQRKDFFRPGYFQLMSLLWALPSRRFENGDAGLEWINMAFSPDARHFVAGYLGPDNISSGRHRRARRRRTSARPGRRPASPGCRTRRPTPPWRGPAATATAAALAPRTRRLDRRRATAGRRARHRRERPRSRRRPALRARVVRCRRPAPTRGPSRSPSPATRRAV